MAPSATSLAHPASTERAARSSVPPARMATPAITSMANAPTAIRAGSETGECSWVQHWVLGEQCLTSLIL